LRENPFAATQQIATDMYMSCRFAIATQATGLERP